LRVLRETYLAAGKLDELEELYASQGDFEALADVLSTSADRATDTSTKVELSFRAASVYERRLDAPDRATRSYERVLAADSTNLRAAAALAPIYEAEERWVRLPSLYQILLDAASEVVERVSILRKLVKITGGPLADRAVALGHARRAYELDPSVESLELLEGAARAASSWLAYVEAIESRLGAIASDAFDSAAAAPSPFRPESPGTP
jgi:hypothetical protein